MKQPKLNITDTELAQFNGADPTKPIYLAVNGSVYDVSASPHMYGPGGGYHFFSGRDATRAFVSGCFAQDLTWDLRGLEEMYVDKEADDAEAAEIAELAAGVENGKRHAEAKEGRLRWLRSRREKRRAEAREKVNAQVAHWKKFFEEHDKYFYVGVVTHESLEGTPIKEVCKKGGRRKGAP